MKPTDFPESNFTFTRPSSMTEEECGDLQVYRDPAVIISCWQLTWRERLRLLFTGRLWLWIMGQGMPPVCMTISSPFRIKKAKEQEETA